MYEKRHNKNTSAPFEENDWFEVYGCRFVNVDKRNSMSAFNLNLELLYTGVLYLLV